MGGMAPVSGSDAMLAVVLTLVFLKRGLATIGVVNVILVNAKAFLVVRGGGTSGSSTSGEDKTSLMCTVFSTIFTTLASVFKGVNVRSIRSGLNATVEAIIILLVT